MNKDLFAGILAGLFSALLAYPLVFKNAATASFLIYFAPLPIMVAALCWRHKAGLIAAFVSALALSFPGMSLTTGLSVLLCIGLPGWGLAYLLLLGRMTASGIEWYPMERIFLCIIAVSGILTNIVLYAISAGSYEQYTQFVDQIVMAWEPIALDALKNSYDRGAFRQAMLMTIPYGLGTWTMFLLFMNIWLAGRIAAKSGLIPRPQPFIPATRMSPVVLGILFIGILANFMGGLVGLYGLAWRSVVIAALFLQGLMFIHFVLWEKPYRRQMLLLLYLSILLVIISGIPVIVLSIVALGIADTLFDFRKKTRQMINR